MMKIKHKFVFGVLFIMINTILTACTGEEVKDSNLNTAINSTSSNHLTANSLKNIPFNVANSDNDLWVNVTNNDVNEQSSLYIMPYNSSGYSVNLVGCDSFDNVDTSGLGDLNGSFPQTKTAPYWLDKKYPETMPDGSKLGNHKIFYNKPKDGSFNCYYRVDIPQTMDSMYIKMVSNNYDVTTPTDFDKKLNYPEKYAESNQTAWIGGSAYLANTLMSSGYATAMYNKIMFRKSTTSMVEVIEKAQDEAMTEFTKILNIRIQEWKTLMDLKNSDDPTIKPYWKKWEQKQIKAFEDNYGKGKNPYLEIDDMETFLDNIDETVGGVFYNGQIKFRVYLADQSKAPEELSPYETDFCTGKPLPNPEDVLREKGISELDPEAWNKVSGKGEYVDGSYEFKDYAVDKDAKFNLGSEMDEAIDVGVETSTSKVLGAVGAEVIGFVVTQEAMDFLMKWIDQSVNGVYTNGVNHVKFEVPTTDDVTQWNSYHSESQQILANTQVTHVATGPNAHSDVFSFNRSSGNNQQITLKLDANVATEPFNRPNQQDDRNAKDPYLGDINSSNKYDAVLSVYISSNQTDTDKIIDEDATDDALAQYGLSSLSTPSLPAPMYSLSNFTQLKTQKNVLLNNLSNKMLTSDGLDGIVINPDYETVLNVAIPKSQLSSELLAAGNNLYGTGFIANYVDENQAGTNLLNNIQSDTLLNLYSKAEIESPTSVSPYLYSKFECGYPVAIGNSCPLKLRIGGMNDGQKHQGKLYVADGSGKLTAIPVYMNYHLLTEPFQYTLNEGDNQEVTLKVANLGSDEYKTLELSDLPINTTIVSNTCNSSLNTGGYCEIKFNFKNVNAGDYKIKLTGETNSGAKPSDISYLGVKISGGW